MSLTRRQLTLAKGAVLLVLWAGIGLLAFPWAGQWFSAGQHASTSTAQVQLSERFEGSPRLLAAAHAYNDRPVAHSRAEYLEQLAVPGTDAIGRLVVPEANINLPIYHGTSDETLLRGIGHLEYSHLPVGGEGTHSVLSAHSGLPTDRMFDRLVDVEPGDEFYLTVAGQTLAYRVIHTEVLDPDAAAQELKPVAGRDLVTLITCTPYAVNSHRFLVTAQRIPYTPAPDADLAAVVQPPPFWPWFAPSLAGIVLAPVLVLWPTRRRGAHSTSRGERLAIGRRVS